jgi:multidrug efflux pump subunit AcrA (membrane-fusion protein)
MTASVEILVDALPHALYVPLEAVIEKDSTRVLYVMEGDRPEPREVVFGIWNDNDIVVREGVEEGQQVCLRDPTVKLETPAMETEATEGSLTIGGR